MLPDSSIVRMRETDCIMVDSAQGSGLWYVEALDLSDGKTAVTQMIPFNQIKSIMVKQYSHGRSIAAGFLGAACVVGIVAIVFVASFHPGSIGPQGAEGTGDCGVIGDRRATKEFVSLIFSMIQEETRW